MGGGDVGITSIVKKRRSFAVDNVLVYDYLGPFAEIYVNHIRKALAKEYAVTEVNHRQLCLSSTDSHYSCIVTFIEGLGIKVESDVAHNVINAYLSIENEICRRSGLGYGRRMSCDVELAVLNE